MCITCALYGNVAGSSPASVGRIIEAMAAPPELAGAPNDDLRSAGLAFLTRWPSVDIHAHPGRFFMEGSPPTPLGDSLPPPFTAAAVADMRRGGVSAVVFAAVADHLLLEPSPLGLRAPREFAPGEAYRDHRRQMRRLRALVAGGTVLKTDDRVSTNRAREAGLPGCLFAVEGGDFIEDRLDRLAEAHAEGVTAITIIHYHINQIGDTQTEAPRWGGLTALGKDIVREMNRLGILVDLSHASFEAAKQATRITSQPVVLSHSNLGASGSDHPRLISEDHARLVVDTGGVVGATSAGFGQDSFDGYIDTILRMIDKLGVDHVAIGTDMDFTYRPVLTSYLDWPLIPGALLDRGLGELDTAKVLGGNYLRLLDRAGRRLSSVD